MKKYNLKGIILINDMLLQQAINDVFFPEWLVLITQDKIPSSIMFYPIPSLATKKVLPKI